MLQRSFKIFISELLTKFGKKLFLLVFLLLFESLVLATSVLTIIPLADFILDGNEVSPYIALFCDMNGDGQINILDILMLVNSVIGI